MYLSIIRSKISGSDFMKICDYRCARTSGYFFEGGADLAEAREEAMLKSHPDDYRGRR
jgi:hypothetical protein